MRREQRRKHAERVRTRLLYDALDRPLSSAEMDAISEEYLRLTLLSMTDIEKQKVFGPKPLENT